jgi:hypothetical protein
MYRVLYDDVDDLEIPQNGRKFLHLKVVNELFGSRNSRTRRSSLIGAFWTEENGAISENFDVLDTEWPGQVNFYLQHSIFRRQKVLTHILAFVSWYSPANVLNPF